MSNDIIDGRRCDDTSCPKVAVCVCFAPSVKRWTITRAFEICQQCRVVTEETVFKLVRRTASGTQNVNGENVSVVIGTCQISPKIVAIAIEFKHLNL